MADKIVILDGYSLMYRAYHALQTPMTAPDGTPTNAVHGFFMMLLKIVEEERPDSLAVAFDMHAPTFRAKLYDGYKATRKPMPDDLRAQDPVIREMIGLMGIASLECEGYEADDILGTVSKRCEALGDEALLVTGDRDSFQLSGPHTTILYTKKGITDTVRVTPEYIREIYGVTPEQMIDVKSLMGDTSDNIPGVPGVGEKTALKLVQQYGSLAAVLDSAEAEQKGKLRERLMEGRALAEMSYALAKIDRDAPIAVTPEAWKLGSLMNAAPRLRELRLNGVLRRLTEVAKQCQPEAAAMAAVEEEELPPVERIDSRAALAARIVELSEGARWAAVYAGAEFSVATDAARLSMAMGGDLLSPGISDGEAWEAALPLLEKDCPKALWDIKSAPVPLERIRGDITDVMLAAYALNPQRPGFDAESLCQQEGVEGFAQHPATALRRLALAQQAQLQENDLERIYRQIELPLAYVLRGMEKEGFLVDAGVLEELGVQFREHIQRLTDEIADLAGRMDARRRGADEDAAEPIRINLNSPKQLGELLFTRLGIPSPKKKVSTNAEVLEQLEEDWPICGKVLEYRKYQKLQSTYIDALIPMRDASGRIHTRFDPVGTATGRISSAEPNLQNIPVRTELGKAIRGAFVARPGWLLVDADYSQIELRVLAHMAQDPTMIHAFNEDQDIHARTAAEVYGVPLDEVTSQMRSASKAVNFGIVYGISEFTLSKNIGVSRFEAKDFIDRYFERYPGVKAYMDAAVKKGHEQGYVTTLMGRRRYLPELNSSNYAVRAFGERCAMNSPIQGTAADIIKLAMIAVDRALREEGFEAKLILQVHDELIVEAPEAEAEAVRDLLRRCMEGVMPLDVPLRTDISIGGDWRACK
ncbi:MAG: DNA polymerase I [Clostridia bacterium]|nr:DNA polymerase I [Clostridia bacterium]